ncbi:transcription elongation factor [Massarina eburnea CBS 473.64]|uniref:Transcription elongation factor n=1 Tax=Massarina eburnea CBS 473.64 TaxID=1395130 RepID=A0A6A6RQJ2_9PLEO|nr:transcription elongation factor [Massarina eburnea CBS 473.64]
MDVKAVELHGKAIMKAMNEKEPSASIIKLLNDLNSGMKPTEDLLRQTRIGVTINKLRTHSDPNVATLANQMVSKWREEVKKKGGPARPKAPASAAVKASNGMSSPAPPASGTASPAPSKKKHTVPSDKRNYKTDKVNYEVTGDRSRDPCVRLMYDGLAFMSEELPEDILPVAKAIEAAAFANAGDTNDAYKIKIRALFQNLKNKGNPNLRQRVVNGVIPPKRFVTMTHDEMKSDERRAADEKLEKENMNNAMVAQVEKSISKEFQCGKCKQRQVSYSQAQTRSADEPMTTFCECMACGNRWKFS